MSAIRRPYRITVGVIVLAFLAVAAGGAALGLALAPASQPASLASAATPEDVTVTKQGFDDSRNVELSVGTSAKRQLISAVSGILTRFTCQAGGVFTSGTASIWADDLPVLNLATSMPLWRELSLETRGADVASLQQELRRLGKDVPDSGYFDWITWNAYRELVEASGGKAEYGTLSRAQVLWLPEAESTIESCEIQVGSTLTLDQPIATLPVALDSVQIRNLPAEAAAGERVLIVDGVSVPVEDQGKIAPEAMMELALTQTYQNYLSTDGQTAMTGTYSLTAPLQVVPVPPSAIYSLGGGQGCVLGDGEPVPVRVVGSQLGRSFITFESDQSPASIRTVPAEEEACR